MKKYIKLLGSIMIAVCLCLSFCSCRQLDKMKARHAKTSIINGETAITLNGNIYKRLSGTAQPVFFPYQSGTLTDQEVPVLLAEIYGDFYNIDSDEILIRVFEDNEAFYCREDKFEQYNHALTNAVLDHYGYYDYSYNAQTGQREKIFKVVDASVTEAVNATLAGIPIDGDIVTDAVLNSFSLEPCDADGIAVGGSYINIRLMANGECFINVPKLNGKDSYPVDAEYLPIINNLAMSR